MWLMNNSNLFLTVLEAVKFKTKAYILCGPTCLFIEWHLAVNITWWKWVRLTLGPVLSEY